MGVIENDCHDRKDLSPNICAVYTEKEYRGKGVARHLLDMTIEDMRAKGISPIYLVTDHIGLYEKYGWEYLCMVQSEGELNSPGCTSIDNSTHVQPCLSRQHILYQKGKEELSVEQLFPLHPQRFFQTKDKTQIISFESENNL